MSYSEFTKEQLLDELSVLKSHYDNYVARGLSLDMSRGKPCKEQLDVSSPMLNVLNCDDLCISQQGFDCRNYGILDGIPAAKELM